MAKKLLCNGAVSVDPRVMSGVPVFAGTRVPIKNLFDYVAAGQTINDFLEAFDWVRREQIEEVLASAYRTAFESGLAA